MVLEDFPFMADLMTSMLREFNVGKVITTCSVQGAQEAVNLRNINGPPLNHIDLVITDLLPPQEDGLKFMKWLRTHKEEPVSFLPILFCSAHASMRVVLSGRDTGANEILVKPLTAEKLAQRLLYIIDKPRPYIKSSAFFGPDRRRQTNSEQKVERRTLKPEDMKVTHESEAA